MSAKPLLDIDHEATTICSSSNGERPLKLPVGVLASAPDFLHLQKLFLFTQGPRTQKGFREVFYTTLLFLALFNGLSVSVSGHLLTLDLVFSSWIGNVAAVWVMLNLSIIYTALATRCMNYFTLIYSILFYFRLLPYKAVHRRFISPSHVFFLVFGFFEIAIWVATSKLLNERHLKHLHAKFGPKWRVLSTRAVPPDEIHLPTEVYPPGETGPPLARSVVETTWIPTQEWQRVFYYFYTFRNCLFLIRLPWRRRNEDCLPICCVRRPQQSVVEEDEESTRCKTAFELCTFVKHRYKGNVDLLGRPHGYGRWVSWQGDEICGQWLAGRPVGPYRWVRNGKDVIEGVRVAAVQWTSLDGELAWRDLTVDCCVSGICTHGLPLVTILPSNLSSPCNATSSIPDLPHRLPQQQLPQQLNCTKLLSIFAAAHSTAKTTPQTALLYFHGFQTYLTKAAKSVGMLAALADFASIGIVPILYSWPAGSWARGYLDSRLTIVDPRFGKFFVKTLRILHEAGVERVHVFAHSLGATAAVEALKAVAASNVDNNLSNPGDASNSTRSSNINDLTNSGESIGNSSLSKGNHLSRPEIASLTFVAADYDWDDFEQYDYAVLRSLCPLITLYRDSCDSALRIRDYLLNATSVASPTLRAKFTRHRTSLDIDIVETNVLEVNVEPTRHCHFPTNRVLIDDYNDIVRKGLRARERTHRLVHLDQNRWTVKCLPQHIGMV